MTGFSYTGKTQVSQIVARRLGWDLVDTDDEIVRIAGKPIPEIFAQDGEPHFRTLERQALANVCERSETVIATGGGIIMSAENREMMKRFGVVVCLEADPETIYRRLMIDSEKADKKVVRPLLAVEDPLARIKSLKESRQLFYDQADWTVRTDHLTPDEVATELIRGWNYVREWTRLRPRCPDRGRRDHRYGELSGCCGMGHPWFAGRADAKGRACRGRLYPQR